MIDRHKQEQARPESPLDRRAFLARSGAAAAAMTGGLLASPSKSTAEDSASSGSGEGSTMLKVALLSQWHPHAKGYGAQIADMPDAKVTVIWDEVPGRGKKWAEEHGCDFEPDIAKLLARDDVDAVLCNAPTNQHRDLLVAAANAGKHIFTEKVLALRIDECNEIAEAVQKAGVTFTISYPFRTKPNVLWAKQAIEQDLIGSLTALRVRVAHDGATGKWLPEHFWDPVGTGGGAMIDLGAHPMYLARYFGGQPKRITSTFTHFTQHELEDNCVSVVEFENGCLGVVETGFVTTYSPFTLELCGTEGTIYVGGPDEAAVQIRSKKRDPKKWTTPDDLPEALPGALRMWVDAVLKGGATPFDLEQATQLTELMQYAYASHRGGGCPVDIPKR